MSKSSRQRQRKNGCESREVQAALAKRSKSGEILALPGAGVPRRYETRDGTVYDNSRYGGFVNVTKMEKDQAQ